MIEKPKKEDVEQIVEVLSYFGFKKITTKKFDIPQKEFILRNKITELNLEDAFVVREDEKIVGFSHYTKINEKEAETTLLVVNPEYRKYGFGIELQEARMLDALDKGFTSFETWCAHPKTQEWYKKHFYYQEEGENYVKHSIYVITCGGKILATGIHYGFYEYEKQKILKCDLVEWKKSKEYIEKNNIQWYVKECGNPFLEKQNIKKPLILNAAITGMIPTKDMTPHVPISQGEVLKDVCNLYKEGVSIFHIHARNEKEEPAWQKEYYEELIYKIKENCPGSIVCTTTSGRTHNTFEKRSDVLNLRTQDMASLTLGSMNFPKTPSINSPEMIKSLALKMKENNILPELEVFEPGMINYGKYLIKKNVLEKPYWFNILLGSLGTMTARVEDLKFMIDILPEDSFWAATGIGKYQFPVNMLAVLMGGHVRFGLEDNIWFDFEKKVLATNMMQLKRIKEFASYVNRPISSAENTRKMLFDSF